MIKAYIIFNRNSQKKEVNQNKKNLKIKNNYYLINSKKKINLNKNLIKISFKWKHNTSVLRKTT